jgi:hypothetical protein
MPYTYRIDPSTQLAQAWFYGTVTKDEIRRFRAELFNDPGWSPSLDRLVDFSQAEGPDFSTADVRALIRDALKAGDQLGTGKLAVVMPKDFSFGMARMYEILEDGVSRPLMVFRDTDAAMEWLDGMSESEEGEPGPGDSP